MHMCIVKTYVHYPLNQLHTWWYYTEWKYYSRAAALIPPPPKAVLDRLWGFMAVG